MTSATLRGVLYPRDGRQRLAVFFYALGGRTAPDLAALVVEKFRATGYL